MTEGLRERKKRQTRQRISEVAIGLFVERGFDNVTIAEVAAAAEVSVNTVYNYFPAKEDLVLPPEEASPHRLADIVRERAPGESAAGAVLARLRREVRGRERRVGLTAGFGRVLEMMRAAPTLTARLEALGAQMTDALAELLAEETGAAKDDPLPRVVAWHLGCLHALVLSEIGRRTAAGERPGTIATAVLELLDAAESVLGERVLAYAVRGE
ncbi:TetR-family transcriptional regulator [[Actinomadura] parvosata subsp. kistnae]|uniref:TetR family transcriptional regulator n=1 Tax=[Actinomadura] parvosata subsp. kistnae TaxID=1909395 RepID=A0A1U9ZXE9_9ACTN|nr:TetR family transcriptional regulator [Nonomuraea sp. ATCC 55076]AQZ62631.1 TetR family transcriptional regulator [Nonomuraea sp. ATCC 55076]SPL88921.1 TetR-family transcriptional regulator [Actinomadura parvosata subsp. kistnae]